jgi:hypothetical protein
MLKRLGLLVLLAAVSIGAYSRPRGAAEREATGHEEDAIKVDLLQPGAAPLAPLRYTHRDAPRTFRLVVQSGIYVMRGVMQGEDSYLPAILTSWEKASGAAPTEDGCVGWRLATADVLPDKKVKAPVVDATKKVVAGLVNREVTTCVGSRGQLRLAMPEAGDAAQRQVIDILAQAFQLDFTVPLPREPVGVGAKWRVRRALPLAVTDATYQLDYELKNVAPKGFETSVTITLSGDPRRVSPQDESVAPPPVVADQIEGEGHGELFSMLDEMTPMQADLSFESVMTLTPSESKGAPTEEERQHAYRLVYRTRELMRAAQLGPMQWGDDPTAQPREEEKP